MLHMKPVDGYVALDTEECRAYGRSLAAKYQGAVPFPHIVIDDFLDKALVK